MTQDDQSTAVAVLREIRDLLAVLVQHSTAAERSALTAEDQRLLGILLPEIRRSSGGALFTLRDLAEQAETDDELRVALGALAHRRLGKLFARCAGVPVDGVRVERVGKVREGILWCVSR